MNNKFLVPTGAKGERMLDLGYVCVSFSVFDIRSFAALVLQGDRKD